MEVLKVKSAENESFQEQSKLQCAGLCSIQFFWTSVIFSKYDQECIFRN